MLGRPFGLLLTLFLTTSVVAQEQHFKLGLAVPLVRWDDLANPYSGEYPPAGLSVGYGQMLDENMWWEMDGILTLREGLLTDDQPADAYRAREMYVVNSLATHLVFHSKGEMVLSGSAGIAWTEVKTRVNKGEWREAVDPRFSPSLGFGLEAGNHWAVGIRRHHRNVTSATLTYRF